MIKVWYTKIKRWVLPKNSLILDEEIFKNDALVFNDNNIKSIILRDKKYNKILKSRV